MFQTKVVEKIKTHFIQKYINNQQMRFNIYGVSYLQYSHPVVVNCAFLNYCGCFSMLHRACCFD